MNRVIAALLVAAGLTGCASTSSTSGSYTTMDKPAQSAMTADLAIAALKEGNNRFVSGNMIKRDLMKHVKTTGYGPYPLATVVSCIDSRAGPEIVFDQGIGDAFSARVAGTL